MLLCFSTGCRDFMQVLEMLHTCHRHRCCNAWGPAWAGTAPEQGRVRTSADAHRLCAQQPVDEVEGEGAEPAPAPPDAVLEPEPPGDGLAACLPLFTAGSGHRRFIRTLKPVAGSSFKARPPLFMRMWQSLSRLHVSSRQLAVQPAWPSSPSIPRVSS